MGDIVYITYDGVLRLHRGGVSKPLTRSDIDLLRIARVCVLADLEDIGVVIMHYLSDWGYGFRCSGVKLNISYITVGAATIKNSSLFDIDLGGDYVAICKKVFDLKLLLMESLGLTLGDRRITSLASVSALLINRELGSRARCRNHHPALEASYFGGRRQWFFPGGTVKQYDFPSMYSKIQCEDYPLEYRARLDASSVARPGFYSVAFSYAGAGVAARLPVREPSGKVSYLASGSGLFWYEELAEFEKCGGVLTPRGDWYEASGLGPYLRGPNEYLLRKRKGGNSAAKGVANRIYGRLALSPSDTVTKYRKLLPDELTCGPRCRSFRKFEDSIVYEDVGGPAKTLTERNIGWASIISARGRAKLMGLMRDCESGGYRIVGVNTDCVELEAEHDVEISGVTFSTKGA